MFRLFCAIIARVAGIQAIPEAGGAGNLVFIWRGPGGRVVFAGERGWVYWFVLLQVYDSIGITLGS